MIMGETVKEKEENFVLQIDEENTLSFERGKEFKYLDVKSEKKGRKSMN